MDKIPTVEELLSMDPEERRKLQIHDFTDEPDGTAGAVGCLYCKNCSDCSYCTDCKDCKDCESCLNCTHCTRCESCSDCIGISGGYNLRYVAYGRQFTEEQWEDLLKL